MSVSNNSEFLKEVTEYLEDAGYDVDRATLRPERLTVYVDIPEEVLGDDE